MYIPFPRSASEHLKMDELVTLTQLMLHTDRHEHTSYVTQQTLADVTGMSEKTVRRHLDHAAEAGFITIHRGGEVGPYGQPRRRNSYLVAWPTQDFIFIERELTKMTFDPAIVPEGDTVKMRGALIMLKTQCLNNTSLCRWSLNELTRHVKASKETLSRFMDYGRKLGLIAPLKDGQTGFRLLVPELSRDVLNPRDELFFFPPDYSRRPLGNQERLWKQVYRTLFDFCYDTLGTPCPLYHPMPVYEITENVIARIEREELIPATTIGEEDDYLLTTGLLQQRLNQLLGDIAKDIPAGTRIRSLNYFAERICHRHDHLHSLQWDPQTRHLQPTDIQ